MQVPAAIKGLFRTRSAPPVPRDKASNEAEDQAQNVARIDDIGAASTGVSAPIQMPRPVRSTGRQPPSVILEQHSSVSSNEEGPNPLLLTQRGRNEAIVVRDMAAPATIVSHPMSPNEPPSYPGSAQPYPVSSSMTPAPAGPVVAAISNSRAPSRDASPAPPLEAILLERKRRLAATLGSQSLAVSTAAAANAVLGVPSAPGTPGPPPLVGSGSQSPATNVASSFLASGGGANQNLGASVAAPVRVATSTSKGTKFKSSPLGPVDRAGLVVAEHVKAKEGQSEETRGEERKVSEGGASKD